MFIERLTFYSSMRSLLLILSFSFYFIWSAFCPAYGQKQIDIDSVYKLSFDEFKEELLPLKKDPSRYNRLLNILIEKGKYNNDISKQSDGYYLLAETSEKNIALSYLDTIINLTETINDYEYPAKAHLKKASIYGTEGEFQKAMAELIKANKLATLRKNIDQEYTVRFYIGILNDDIGKKEEALKILRSVKEFREKEYLKNKNQKNTIKYLRLLFAVGDSYNRNKKYDSAYYINKNAIRLALKNKDTLYYGRFLLSSGITHFGKNEYSIAIDSILKYKNLYRTESVKPPNFFVADLYLGQSYYKNENYNSALPYLKKIDSLVFTKKYFFPAQRPVFEHLIDHYKRNNEIEKQLEQISKLISFDSIISNNYKDIQRELVSKYETPILLSQKQQLINKLNDKSQIKDNYLWLIGFLLLVSLALFVWNYRLKNVYKKRFLKVIETIENEENTTEVTGNKPKQKSGDIGIPENVIDNTLKFLKKFEEKEKFLNSNISINSVAKDFNTNSKYLSKIINTYKGKTFSNYINDLRITHVIKRLKDETLFRNYKMTIISKESGFNTPQAFSKSFYKKTGMQPSYFIKELNKNE